MIQVKASTGEQRGKIDEALNDQAQKKELNKAITSVLTATNARPTPCAPESGFITVSKNG